MAEKDSDKQLGEALKKALADFLRRRAVLLKRLRYHPEKTYMRGRPAKS